MEYSKPIKRASVYPGHFSDLPIKRANNQITKLFSGFILHLQDFCFGINKMSAQKRKADNELPIKNKLDVLKDLHSGLLSQRKIAEKYAIGRSTVQRIAASREKFDQEADNAAHFSRKRIKRGTRNEDKQMSTGVLPSVSGQEHSTHRSDSSRKS